MQTPISIQNIYEKIKSAPLDPAVGIRVVPLVGDDAFTLFAAEIGAHKRVGAHFHAEGLEIYQIVEGRGDMHVGKPIGDGQTAWHATAAVRLAMEGLEPRKGVGAHVVEINRLENAGDKYYRRTVAKLFSGQYEALEVLKLKDIVDSLEHAIDAFEKVANIIEQIHVKES